MQNLQYIQTLPKMTMSPDFWITLSLKRMWMTVYFSNLPITDFYQHNILSIHRKKMNRPVKGRSQAVPRSPTRSFEIIMPDEEYYSYVKAWSLEDNLTTWYQKSISWKIGKGLYCFGDCSIWHRWEDDEESLCSEGAHAVADRCKGLSIAKNWAKVWCTSSLYCLKPNKGKPRTWQIGRGLL